MVYNPLMFYWIPFASIFLKNFARIQLQQPRIQPEGVSSVGKKLREPLSFLGLPVYFKLMILFLYFYKSIMSEV